ncbi:MAG: HAMP domain-containing histidine kinase [Clostridia bacterium]|nr:HAMP domain-containing histidine kinase [Clostridia bacterium]
MTPAPQNQKFHTRRPPRRRTGVGGRISISWKLFVYLTLFTLFILLVVWIMQIGLLEYFYGQSKQKELDRADQGIIQAIRENPAELPKTVKACAADYLLCVRVFRVDGGTAHQLASAEVSDDCLIHRISDKYLTFLYNEAVAGGGLYTKRISPEILYLTNPDAMAGWADEFPRQDPDDILGRLPEAGLERSTNMVHVRVISGDMGESYIIMLNSELEPLNATVETLKTQFWVIAMILLWSALFLAILISRIMAEPIKKMNRAAKLLAKGNYDADFSVGGYREAVELSKSLTHASEQLAGTDRLQKELIANISHDLRTPLTMIIGYSEVMRDLPGENTPENVQVIIDETERLAQLVNDLLDLSKIRAGSRAPKMEVFNLTELVEATMLRYEKLTEKDGYRIEYESDASVDIRADRTMLLQVIYNLINNAINYTGDDKLVRVTQKLSEDGTRVRVSVTDNGVGIAPDQIPLIWDRYYKIDKVHRRAMIGTGLGLSIVKQILEAHSTTYGVESKLGEGSTFWFEMRVEAVAEKDTEDAVLLEDTPLETDYLPSHHSDT